MAKYKIICINLKRRSDRKEKMMDIFKKNNMSCEFFEAIDGNELKSNHPDLYLFRENDFNDRRGVIGCALSHYYLYQKLIHDTNYDYYVILEDDSQFVNNFNNKFIETINKITPEMDLIFLGYTMPNNILIQNYQKYINNNIISLHKLNKHNYYGGLFGYIISKNGAAKILNYINLNGIKRAIDGVVIDANVNVYESQPFLAKSLSVQFQSNSDSDIQKDFSKIPIESIKPNTNNKIYISFGIVGFILLSIFLIYLIYAKIF
jgi:glycosyl transferase, family 25